MRIVSRLEVGSSEYRANRATMEALVAQLRERQQTVRQAGRADRFKAKGKCLPRERVELLLDPGSSFLELSPLAAWDLYQNESPGASVITGIGRVEGRPVMVVANEASIKGGAFYPMTLKKMLRAQQIALENRLLCLLLVESAGANLLYQAELFADQGGRVFANQTRMSARGIPQISLVFGSSTAGGAYLPGMSDYTVMVRKQAQVFLGGPPLVKMATGEEVDEETLGGADMHAQVSGVSDYTALDDADAIRLGRSLVAALPYAERAARRRPARPPHYDPEELLGIIPADPRHPFDAREVIARLVDGSEFLEFKAEYGTTLVCGQAHLDGYPVGVLANNGVLFSESANKGAQFIQLCNQARIPLIYLQNITGFMVGSATEREGLVKHGSKLINAVANSSVPQFTVILGGSYGAGNYAMCGRSLDPTLLFAWPGSQVAVMGGEQAAGVMTLVAREQARSRGKQADEAALEAQAQALKARFAEEASPYYATARIWDDGLIDPRHTRQVLAVGLNAAHQTEFAEAGAPRYGTFRM